MKDFVDVVKRFSKPTLDILNTVRNVGLKVILLGLGRGLKNE